KIKRLCFFHRRPRRLIAEFLTQFFIKFFAAVRTAGKQVHSRVKRTAGADRRLQGSQLLAVNFCFVVPLGRKPKRIVYRHGVFFVEKNMDFIELSGLYRQFHSSSSTATSIFARAAALVVATGL